jgi:hypothetical protein
MMDMYGQHLHRTAAVAFLAVAVGGARAKAAELVEMPPRAPRAAVTQDVGLTHISVVYRSAAVRGRSIWGGRVAFGEPWRAGDSPEATITFSSDVTVGGRPIAAGTYALIPTPGPESWTFFFESLAVGKGGAAAPLPVRVEAPVERGEARERLRFVFATFTRSAARLDLEWERVRVSLPIAVDTDGQIASAIAELDRRDADLGRKYARAAEFLLSEKRGASDRERGRAFLERATALGVSADDSQARAAFAAREPEAEPEIAHPPLGGGLGSPAAIEPPPLSGPAERAAKPTTKATRAPGADEIGPVISKGQPAIEACYQRALRRDPSLGRGKITVQIVIGRSGHVSQVDVEAPESLRPIEECVKTAVSRWAFPPSPEAYATELPLVLDRRD